MWHVNRSNLYIVNLVFLNQPFERQGIPHNLSFTCLTHFTDSIAHKLGRLRIIAPTIVVHQMMADTTIPYGDFMLFQISESPDLDGIVNGSGYTLGKKSNRIAAIPAETIVESGGKSEHQV